MGTTRAPASRKRVKAVLRKRLDRVLKHLRKPGLLDSIRFHPTEGKGKVVGGGGGLSALQQALEQMKSISGPPEHLKPDKNGVVHLDNPKPINDPLRFAMEPVRLLGEMREQTDNAPASGAEALDMVKAGADELVERTWWLMHRMAFGKSPGVGWLLEDKPKGYHTTVLEHAAESFPWATSCDAGRLLHMLLVLANETAEGEIPLGVWPADVSALEVARWWEGHMVLGVIMAYTSLVEQVGWFPSPGSHAPTAPDGLPAQSGVLPAEAFAVLYRSHQVVGRWHRPHDDRHEGHKLAAAAVLKQVQVTDAQAHRELATALYTMEAELRAELNWPELTQRRQASPQGDMLKADAVLADYLERQGVEGATRAETVRQYARERWAKGLKGAELYRLWVDDKDAPRFMRQLAHTVWADEVQPDREASRFMVSSVRVQGDDYAKVGKTAGAISWALGAPGVGVEIDGSQYAKAPKVARYLSRGVSVLPESSRPAQQTLPLELTDPDATSFALRAVGDTQYVISPTGGKLLLLSLATARPGGLMKGTVAEVTRAMNPTKKRIQARDYENTARAAWEQTRVRVVLPDDTSVSLLDMRMPRDPERATRDQTMAWTYGANFLQFAQGQGYKPLRGDFVMNLTGAMSLSANEHPLLRQYIFACGLWNDAKHPTSRRFDPNYLEAFTIKDWAAKTNSLSTAAVDYLKEHDPKKRSKLSRDRKHAREALESLCDQHQLVVLEKVGKDRYKVLPPKPLLEAYEQHRKGARRPSEPGQFGLPNGDDDS